MLKETTNKIMDKALDLYTTIKYANESEEFSEELQEVLNDIWSVYTKLDDFVSKERNYTNAYIATTERNILIESIEDIKNIKPMADELIMCCYGDKNLCEIVQDGLDKGGYLEDLVRDCNNR